MAIQAATALIIMGIHLSVRCFLGITSRLWLMTTVFLIAAVNSRWQIPDFRDRSAVS